MERARRRGATDIEIHDAVLIDNFCAQPNCSYGALVYAGLAQATHGNLYGGTAEGGINDTCRLFVPRAAVRSSD